MKVVRPWPRLPEEAVDALCLQAAIQARLDRALGNLVYGKVSLPKAEAGI